MQIPLHVYGASFWDIIRCRPPCIFMGHDKMQTSLHLSGAWQDAYPFASWNYWGFIRFLQDADPLASFWGITRCRPPCIFLGHHKMQIPLHLAGARQDKMQTPSHVQNKLGFHKWIIKVVQLSWLSSAPPLWSLAIEEQSNMAIYRIILEKKI